MVKLEAIWLAGLFSIGVVMASDRFESLQHLQSYTEVIDGSVEPDRIPYSAAAYPVMVIHRSILKNIARRKLATELHSSEENEIVALSLVGRSEPESETSGFRPALCAEFTKQITSGYHDLEAMAQILVTSEEKDLASQEQKVEAYRKSMGQADRDEFDYEVQKFKSNMNYSQTDYPRFSLEMPEHFLAFARHVCK
jgi:hypothetical protein